MRAAGDSIILHPAGTFSNVTGNRCRIREKIFADIFNWDKSVDAAGKPESEQVLVDRRATRSFRDATSSRSRVRGEILAAIFNRYSSGGSGGGGSSNLVLLRLPNGSLGDSLLHCFELLAYLFKKEPMD